MTFKTLPDYVAEAGKAAIGARLRRLSNWVDTDARKLYADQGVAFEQRWLGILDLLSSHEPLTVGELAAALGISHPSVSESRQSLVKAGLVALETDAKDQRRRALRLTAAGRALVERLQPLWAAFDEVAIEIDGEAGNVQAALEKLETVLRAKSFYERVKERFEPRSE